MPIGHRQSISQARRWCSRLLPTHLHSVVARSPEALVPAQQGSTSGGRNVDIRWTRTERRRKKRRLGRSNQVSTSATAAVAQRRHLLREKPVRGGGIQAQQATVEEWCTEEANCGKIVVFVHRQLSPSHHRCLAHRSSRFVPAGFELFIYQYPHFIYIKLKLVMSTICLQTLGIVAAKLRTQ